MLVSMPGDVEESGWHPVPRQMEPMAFVALWLQVSLLLRAHWLPRKKPLFEGNWWPRVTWLWIPSLLLLPLPSLDSPHLSNLFAVVVASLHFEISWLFCCPIWNWMHGRLVSNVDCNSCNELDDHPPAPNKIGISKQIAFSGCWFPLSAVAWWLLGLLIRDDVWEDWPTSPTSSKTKTSTCWNGRLCEVQHDFALIACATTVPPSPAPKIKTKKQRSTFGQK